MSSYHMPFKFGPEIFYLLRPLLVNMAKILTARTDTSAVVRAYPWSNGVVLCEDRHSYLQGALEGSEEPQNLIDMALVRNLQVTREKQLVNGTSHSLWRSRLMSLQERR